MNRIGIIGGIGPETTVEYYRRILDLYRRRNPDGSAPYIIINSLDMKKPLEMLTANKLEELATLLSEEVKRWLAPVRLLPSSRRTRLILFLTQSPGNLVFRSSASLKRLPTPR